MDARGNEADLREIFAHQEWVRALALRLCGDHAAADDLVQDTWIEALRRRDNVSSVRAWLGGIVRHRWRRDRLRSSARAEREASVARDPRTHAMPSPEGLLAQAELQRRVLAAVASLEEAARTVVLLRYYEGLSSEAIAERLHEPASTVRNRLARAHEKLRGKLDDEYGGGRGEWSVLLVPSGMSHAGSLSTGIGVAMKMKLLVTVAILAASSAVLWFTLKPDANAATSSATALGAASPDRVATTETSAIAATTSEAKRAPIADSPAASTEPLLLWGELHGPTPEQAAQAEIWMTGDDGVRKSLSPGASATYSAFGLHPGTTKLFVAVHGFVAQQDEIVLAAGAGQVRHDVTLVPAFILPIKFVDRSTGQPLKPSRQGLGSDLAALATHTRPTHIDNLMSRKPWSAEGGTYRADEGFGSREEVPAGYDGILEIHPPLPVYVSCVLRDTVIDSRLVHGNEKDLVFEIDPAELSATYGRFVVRCVDPTGAAVVDASISGGYQDSTGGASAKTTADGNAVMEHVLPGMQELVIRAKGFGNYVSIVRILPHATTDLGTIELRPTVSVHGRVVDASGQPVDARVTVVPVRQCASPRLLSGSRSYPCRPGGKFEIDSVERGPCRLIAQAKGFAWTVMDVDTSGGGIADLEVRMQPGTLVRFKTAKTCMTFVPFVVADASGAPIQANDVSAMFGREMSLLPGHYQCWTLLDERIVSKQGFDVGTASVEVEVQAL